MTQTQQDTRVAAQQQLADALQRVYARMLPHVGTPPWTLGGSDTAAEDLVADLVDADPGLRAEAAQAIVAVAAVPADPAAGSAPAPTWWSTPLGRLCALGGAPAPEGATLRVAEAVELLGVSRQLVDRLARQGVLTRGVEYGTVTLESVLARLRVQARS